MLLKKEEKKTGKKRSIYAKNQLNWAITNLLADSGVYTATDKARLLI
jgi:hypothetical protein